MLVGIISIVVLLFMIWSFSRAYLYDGSDQNKLRKRKQDYGDHGGMGPQLQAARYTYLNNDGNLVDYLFRVEELYKARVDEIGATGWDKVNPWTDRLEPAGPRASRGSRIDSLNLVGQRDKKCKGCKAPVFDKDYCKACTDMHARPNPFDAPYPPKRIPLDRCYMCDSELSDSELLEAGKCRQCEIKGIAVAYYSVPPHQIGSYQHELRKRYHKALEKKEFSPLLPPPSPPDPLQIYP